LFQAASATAGMVGHDIRNPLQAITGDLYLAREGLKEMPQGKGRQAMAAAIDAIEESVVYINKIVSDLQDFTRPLKPTQETINLTDLLTTVSVAANVSEKIKTQIVSQEKLILQADPTYLRRALTNLIVNAVQAMPNGGTLTIQA
jgi:signal transduction histidine kinase